jgi:hypothetical protein
MKFCGNVIDATTGGGIEYPWPRDQARWKFDMLVRNGDAWCYVFSSDKPDSGSFQRLARKVETGGGIWRVVTAATGEVVRRNQDEHPCWN